MITSRAVAKRLQDQGVGTMGSNAGWGIYIGQMTPAVRNSIMILDTGAFEEGVNDIFETSEGLKINEVNHTMEFKNSEQPTRVSISGKIIEYCLQIATHNRENQA